MVTPSCLWRSGAWLPGARHSTGSQTLGRSPWRDISSWAGVPSASSNKVFCGVGVAVKFSQVTSGMSALINELRILRQLRHPNLAFAHGAIVDSLSNQVNHRPRPGGGIVAVEVPPGRRHSVC